MKLKVSGIITMTYGFNTEVEVDDETYHHAADSGSDGELVLTIIDELEAQYANDGLLDVLEDHEINGDDILYGPA